MRTTSLWKLLISLVWSRSPREPWPGPCFPEAHRAHQSSRLCSWPCCHTQRQEGHPAMGATAGSGRRAGALPRRLDEATITDRRKQDTCRGSWWNVRGTQEESAGCPDISSVRYLAGGVPDLRVGLRTLMDDSDPQGIDLRKITVQWGCMFLFLH